MNTNNEFGMKLLLAKCPQCEGDSLYCGMIPTAIKTLTKKEVLFCQDCKFVLSVDEYKEILLRA